MISGIAGAHISGAEGHICLQAGGPGVQHPNLAVRLVLEDILAERFGIQGVGLGSIGQIGDGELKFIHTGALGIIAQLGLDLVVLLSGHLDEGIGLGGQVHTGQTCALVHQRVVAAGSLLQQRLSGGHQQALSQMADADAGALGQPLLPNNLGQQGGHTGDLGRSHGGTGHGFILVAAAAGDGVGAPQGVDLAAGGGDLRLQRQTAGHAPGAEVTHRIVFGVVHAHAHLAVDSHLAGVGDVAELGRGGHDRLGIGVQEADNGHGIAQTRQIHAEHPVVVVVDHNGSSATGGGVVGLDGEVQRTTGHEDHLAADIQTGVILLVAQTVDQHVLILGAAAVSAGVQADEGGVAEAQILIVEAILAGGGEVVANGAVVLHGGHGEGVGIGAGGTHGVEGHVIVVQVA